VLSPGVSTWQSVGIGHVIVVIMTMEQRLHVQEIIGVSGSAQPTQGDDSKRLRRPQEIF
jgi:hypothetical protein